MKRKYILPGLLLCLLLLPLSALAADWTFSVTCPADPSETTLYSRKLNNRYTIALPAVWDVSRLVLSFENESPVFIGETEVRSGDLLDASSWLGQELPLKNARGGSLGTLLIQQGSRVVNVLIRADAKELSRIQKDKNLILSEGSVLITEPDGAVVWNGPFTQLKGRGNNTYSSAYGKKPFQLKLPKKVDISGMGKGKTWLLIANYIDLSLLRNQIALDLALEAGMRFGVESVQADVWLNGVYNGLYLLTEKIQISGSRVDITNLEEETEALNEADVSTFPTFKKKEGTREIKGYEIPVDPEDITGGYIIELEKSYRYRSFSKNGFQHNRFLTFVIKEPTCASRAQAAYLGGLFEKLLRGLEAGDGFDPVTGVHYTELIDLPSFALKFLMEDLTKNHDALAGSQFFYKDRDSIDPKIYAGPCWDYDLSMGDMAATGTKTDGCFVLNIGNGKSNLYRLFWKHEDFRREVYRVYREQLRPALSILLGEADAPGRVLCSLEAYRDAIAESAAMNFVRWNPGAITGYNKRSGTTNPASTAWLLDWLTKRTAFMDTWYGEEAAENNL